MPAALKDTNRIWWIVGGVAALLVLGFAGWRLTADSIEDLLALSSPTPAQIRKIAEMGLLHDDLKIRAQATDKLSGLGEKAKPVLREVAEQSGNSNLRFACLTVLRGMDSASAAQVMAKMAQDKDSETRVQAVNLAAGTAGSGASTVLEKAMDDPDVGVRSAAAGSLDPRSSPNAEAKLRAALKDSDTTVRRHAARQLRKLQAPR